MTICTTRLACMISRTIDRFTAHSPLLWLCPLIAGSSRNMTSGRRLGFRLRRIQAGHAHPWPAAALLPAAALAPDALPEGDAWRRRRARLAADRQQIIEPRRPLILDLDRHHREQDPRIERQRALRQIPASAAIRCAHARGISDSSHNKLCRRRRCPPSRPAPARRKRLKFPRRTATDWRRRVRASCRPKCCQARRVAIRPRAVRARSPAGSGRAR